MALVVMRAGQGNLDIVACLVRIVCLAYLMEAMVRGHGTPKPYRAAEAILEESAARARHGESWCLRDEEAVVIERILAVHDAQLASMPSYFYDDALTRLQHFVGKERRSPIPGE
ncbi:hypothetical protein AB3X91_19305 [Paraburkholderia sp. BR14263]